MTQLSPQTQHSLLTCSMQVATQLVEPLYGRRHWMVYNRPYTTYYAVIPTDDEVEFRLLASQLFPEEKEVTAFLRYVQVWSTPPSPNDWINILRGRI